MDVYTEILVSPLMVYHIKQTGVRSHIFGECTGTFLEKAAREELRNLLEEYCSENLRRNLCMYFQEERSFEAQK
jgi:hypothetical protein